LRRERSFLELFYATTRGGDGKVFGKGKRKRGRGSAFIYGGEKARDSLVLVTHYITGKGWKYQSTEGLNFEEKQSSEEKRGRHHPLLGTRVVFAGGKEKPL